MIALAIAFCAVSWCATYVATAWIARRLLKELPDDPSERVVEIWRRASAGRNTSMLAILPGIVVFVVFHVVTFSDASDPDSLRWRMYVPSYVVWFVGLWLAQTLAVYKLDRVQRGSTWELGEYLRVKLGLSLLGNLGIWNVVLVGEGCRQAAPAVLETGHATLALLGVALAVLLVWSIALLVTWKRLLRLEEREVPEIRAALDRFLTRPTRRPLRILVMEERGGHITNLALTRRALLVSQFALDNMAEEDVPAIVAHEVGHALHKDLLRRRLLSGMPLLVLVALTSLADTDAGQALYLLPPFWIVAAPLLVLLVMSPLAVRSFHTQELRADASGAKLLGDPELMAGALERFHRLASLPPTFPKNIKVTHPSLSVRLEALRRMAAASAAAPASPEQ